MEKFSQYRDRGSGVAPFLPIPAESSSVALPFYLFLYLIRVPLLLSVVLCYFLVLQWLPIGELGRKAALWVILAVPGIWWVDLQIDGVKKGSLAQNARRLPGPGSIIASSSASPIDALYLAAIFDPIFTASYPSTRLMQPLTLFQAMLRAFQSPEQFPHPQTPLTDLPSVLARYPGRAVVVFPECTTTNGKGILPLGPSLLTSPSNTKVFPVSLRYTPSDITTPIPKSFSTFLWNLCSRPTHCIRVRIAEAVYNAPGSARAGVSTHPSSPPSSPTPTTTRQLVHQQHRSSLFSDRSSDDTTTSSSTDSTIVDVDQNHHHYSYDNKNNTSRDALDASKPSSDRLSKQEQIFLDRVAEALARLGRVRRVGLGVREKQDFVQKWASRGSNRRGWISWR